MTTRQTLNQIISNYRQTKQLYKSGIEEVERLTDPTRREIEDAHHHYDVHVSAAMVSADRELGVLKTTIKNSINRRDSRPPSAEQLAVLQTLSIKTPTQREIDLFSEQMRDCPVALSTLADVARKHKLTPPTIVHHASEAEDIDNAMRMAELYVHDSLSEYMEMLVDYAVDNPDQQSILSIFDAY